MTSANAPEQTTFSKVEMARSALDAVMKPMANAIDNYEETQLLHSYKPEPGMWVVEAGSDKQKLEFEVITPETAMEPAYVGLIKVELYEGGDMAWEPADWSFYVRPEDLDIRTVASAITDQIGYGLAEDLEREAKFSEGVAQATKTQGSFLIMEPEDIDREGLRIVMTAKPEPSEAGGIDEQVIQLAMHAEKHTWSAVVDSYSRAKGHELLGSAERSVEFKSAGEAFMAAEAVAHGQVQAAVAAREAKAVVAENKEAPAATVEYGFTKFKEVEPGVWSTKVFKFRPGADKADEVVPLEQVSETALRKLAERTVNLAVSQNLSLKGAREQALFESVQKGFGLQR